jgi:Uracil DNA glycosylase superfamily
MSTEPAATASPNIASKVAGAQRHRCAVRLAHDSATRPALVGSDWCFAAFREKLAAAYGAIDTHLGDFRLWSQEGLELYYAPFDWVNRDARLVLIGITPGAYQMRRGLSVAAELAGSDMSDDEVLAACKASASFSGPMRDLLIGMLDEIGVARGLGLASTASLWEADQNLASFTSTICYPAFVNGTNYSGERPRIDQVPILREFAEQILSADLSLTPDALIVPLGKRPTECVARLVELGRIEAHRCLLGMPHPSPANGHRAKQFAERRDQLCEQAATYFSTG